MFGLEDKVILVTGGNRGIGAAIVKLLEALEAQVAHGACRDAAVREVLERIAIDETRHATLAWKFVAWVLTEHPELESTVAASFEAAMKKPAPTIAQQSPEPVLGERGVLSAQQRRDLRAHALEEVVAPCARALLTSAEQQGTAQWLAPLSA